MVYDELRQSPRSSTEEVKVAILSLNGLLHTESARLDPEPIRQAKIFPVRYPTGTVALSSVSVDFAIGDRDKLMMMFSDKIALLDFEMEDVRRLKPLIEWLRLQDRYLSNSVEESTSISSDSGRPISTPNRDLKRKAYHIARYVLEEADIIWKILTMLYHAVSRRLSTALDFKTIQGSSTSSCAQWQSWRLMDFPPY